MRRCIHCTREKHESEFNREHVSLEAFGTFENNLVITAECKECNQFYGNTLDLKFARDTMEGFSRYEVGVKPASEFKSLGRRSTTHVEFQEGRLRGATGYHVKSPDGTDLGVTSLPYVWFWNESHEEVAFRLGGLPTPDELKALGFKPGSLNIRTEGEKDTEKIRAALAAKGFAFDVVSTTPPPTGSVRMEAVFKIGEPEFRAVTKIALNYLAAVTSGDVVLMPAFDEARRFARNGVKPPKRIVHARTNRKRFVDDDGETLNGHYLCCAKIGEEIVAQVCIMMKTRYTITLARGGVLLPVPFGHFFNLRTNVVVPIPALPLEDDARDDEGYFTRVNSGG